MNYKTNNVSFPPVIFGTAGLGNMYEVTPYETKRDIISECIKHAPGGVMFDTAGKYGAGLALEVLGKALKELNVGQDDLIISNKLGWYRVPLLTDEPTFEKDVWKGIEHDAIQKISYEGILECYEQGNELLGEYHTHTASVHDPDEYLAAAADATDEADRYRDIMEAYRALQKLKQEGKINSVGVGAKNWRSVQRISNDVELDWVMIANSITVHSHPKELLQFVQDLHNRKVVVINSAVFNGGFLVGREYYNYQFVDPATTAGKALYEWREKFFDVCKQFEVQPAEACFNFGFHTPGVSTVALSTSRPEKVKQNIAMATREMPPGFWQAMVRQGLIEDFSFLK